MSAHTPVMLEQAVHALAIRPTGIYVDATAGRGGHSRSILQSLDVSGRLIALDRDPMAIAAVHEEFAGDRRCVVRQARFSELTRVLTEIEVQRIDGVLFDLGVSSPQLDDAERGFSFKRDGPLDMRMNPNEGISAAQWLAQVDERQLTGVIAQYGEERFAQSIARAIVKARARDPIVTTQQLAALVAGAVRTREVGQDPATRTFQAIRIFLNAELEELSAVLKQIPDLLRVGGRLVVISFHSLEDRIVKQFMREMANPAAQWARLALPDHLMPQPLMKVIGKAQRATATEIAANPRARSAMLRVAERTQFEKT